MKIIVAPDSFKGSLTALQAAEAMRRGAYAADSSVEVTMLPMADGGEGFVEAIVAAEHGSVIEVEATDPLGRRITSAIGLIDGGETAVIEIAAASGLTLVREERRNPLISSTYGTGELIKAALDRGCKRIFVGLGGSATNDGGIGMAQALGYRFRNGEGKLIEVGGTGWHHVAKIEADERDPRLDRVEVIAACDVDAPLYGERGASAVFGPQKGATPEMVAQLDRILRKLAHCIERDLRTDIHTLPGGGAAGGLGAAMVAFCGARLVPGIELVLDACKFEQKLDGADLVLTGEGNTDAQSAMGKTPVGVAKRAKRRNVPVVCLSGGLGEGYAKVKEYGIDAIFSIMPRPAALPEAMEQAAAWLEEAAREVVALAMLGLK